MNEPLRFPDPETNLDRIRAHVFAGNDISFQEMRVLDRYNFIDNQISQGLTDKEIVSAVIKKFEVSTAQAYRDLSATKLVFASRTLLDKNYYRWWLFQQHLKLYKKLELNDRFKEMVELQKQIYKTVGLDQEDPKVLDPDQYGNHQFFMIINQDSGPKIQINFNEAHKMSEEDFNKVREQLENNFQEEQQNLLNKYVDDRHGKQKES
ncbi:MAG TPA: hypothetical protein PKD91_01965 [Bacteroidia bacterium]|nr:hypothetical protein [Bacteroidia bacterium]